VRRDEFDAFDFSANHAVDRIAAAASDSDDFDLRRLKLLAEAHPDSSFLCHAPSTFSHVCRGRDGVARGRASSRVTRLRQTWLSIWIRCCPGVAAENAAPLLHTKPSRQPWRSRVARPAPAYRPNL